MFTLIQVDFEMFNIVAHRGDFYFDTDKFKDGDKIEIDFPFGGDLNYDYETTDRVQQQIYSYVEKYDFIQTGGETLSCKGWMQLIK